MRYLVKILPDPEHFPTRLIGLILIVGLGVAFTEVERGLRKLRASIQKHREC